MLYIVLLHSLGQGGLLIGTIENSIQYKCVWFLEICAYGAVNIFAIISGYVGYSNKEKPVRISNYLRLWLQVVFYGFLIGIIFKLVRPELISVEDFIRAAFPVTNKLYWYFTAYTGLFMIMPILNNGIRATDNNLLKKMFIVIIIAFSVFDNISKGFVLNDGYSFIWITLLYIIGAIMKKCEIGRNLKAYKIILTIIGLYIVTYLFKIYGPEFQIMDINISKYIFVSFVSPTILISSILHLILFTKIKFNNIWIKFIKFMAPSTFSVYLINNNKQVWQYIMKDLFSGICESHVYKIFVYVIGFSVMFVIGSILLDKFRIFLFSIAKVPELTNKIEDMIKN